MEVKDWLQAYRDLVEKKKWDDVEEMETAQKQAFVDARDHEGLIQFADTFSTLIPNLSQWVSFKDQSQFTQRFLASLKQAIVQASADPQVKALYFEYYYDSDDSSANIFLCDRYSKDQEDDWNAYFRNQVECPNLFDLFEYRSSEQTPLEDVVTSFYMDCHLLSSILRQWTQVECPLPFAFAIHDGLVVFFNA